MPRRKLPPRLQLRKRKSREPVYVIRDGDDERSTGFGPERSEDAEAALSEYLITKLAIPSSVMTPDTMAVGTALTIYAKEHAITRSDPARIAYAIQALAPFWGDLPVSAIKTATCRRYANGRDAKLATARRELGTLAAALNYCVAEGYLTVAPPVWLPEKSAPRDRWLTRDEIARLIRAARNRKNHHLARFILLSLYTGTRKSAVLSLQWIPNFTGGHIDLETGRMYRKAATARETNKKQTPINVPKRLLMHLHHWRDETRQFAIEWNGQSVKDIKKAWAGTCADAGVENAPPHTLRHTAITWAMQGGAKIEDASGFFGVSVETLQRVYWHHHPDYQQSVHDAFEFRGFRG